MRKHAPRIVALILTSRSMGNVMPKLSASVNISCARPLHCFDTLPTSLSPSGVRTWSSTWTMNYGLLTHYYECLLTLNSTSPRQLHVQKGPSIRSTTAPAPSLITYFGLQMLHFCSTVPTTVPGGEETSSFCRQEKNMHIYMKLRTPGVSVLIQYL